MMKVKILKNFKEKGIWTDGFWNGISLIIFGIMSVISFNILISSTLIWAKIIGFGLGILFAILSIRILIKLWRIMK